MFKERIMAENEVFGWNDSLLSGVDEMDRQHHILVDMLVEITDKPNDIDNEALFDRVTQDLLAYAIYHFETEESLMKELGYAQAAPEDQRAHVAAHRGFARQVVAMREEVREGLPGGNQALLKFLKDWLVNHIMTIDKRLGRFVAGVRQGAGAG
jgi:hemerythrin